MTRGVASACIVALVLLVPTSLAAQDLSADALLLAGSTSVQGEAAALFFVSLDDGVTWDATADSATLVRDYRSYKAVAHPLADTYLFAADEEWQTETVEMGALSLSSSGTIPYGAMLVRAQTGTATARSEGIVSIRPSVDPVVEQNVPDTAGSGYDNAYIIETIPGELLNATFSEGVFTFTGDLTIDLYGPAYAIRADGATNDMRTGEFETARTAQYVEGQQERHQLTLLNAVLHLRSTESVSLFTEFPTVAVDGTLQADNAEGGIVLDGVALWAPADGEPLVYNGAATLALAPNAGRVSATSPGATLATAGAIAAQGPSILLLGGAGALVALATLVALALWVRRRSRADDLELAILAMEERRWEDALPRLTRLAKREPNNAHVLLDRALCLEQVGRFAEAARAFESALRAAPRHAEAHFYYARTLAKMREKDAARAHLEEALERDPRLVEMARTERVLHGL